MAIQSKAVHPRLGKTGWARMDIEQDKPIKCDHVKIGRWMLSLTGKHYETARKAYTN